MVEKELEINDLHVEVEGKEILKGLSLSVNEGEISAIMGPNGSGKSTLANVIMGHPRYSVKKGKIFLKGEDITELKPHERAQKGLFLAFQYPYEIEGVPLGRFLWRAVSLIREMDGGRELPSNPSEFNKQLRSYLEKMGLDWSFRNRELNVGFSGGEKKRTEMVQILSLRPRLVILDEIDSGLDIDSVKLVAEAINEIKGKTSFLIITHYQRILDYVHPDSVHVLVNGRIVESGGPELVKVLEKEGYDRFKEGGD